LLANDIGKLTWVTERDSAKDEAVVFIFIFATVGLLIYAAVRPWVEKWTVAMRERRSYIPISTAAGADES
jgi:ABC-type nitrate/sulfonate/bicarbonate transport system permease component